jgi:transcriptional regulator with XRE-family HTH domain
MELGERLRSARHACALGQKEVAEALGIGRSTLVRWEKGEHPPKTSDLHAFAHIYQVTVKWLLEGGKDGPSESVEAKEFAKHALDELKQGIACVMVPYEPAESPTAITKVRSSSRNGASFQARMRAFALLAASSPSERPEALVVDTISERVKLILASRPELRSIPGISLEVLQAMRSGLVVPSSHLMPLLAEATHVSPDLYWSGQEEEGLDQPSGE